MKFKEYVEGINKMLNDNPKLGDLEMEQTERWFLTGDCDADFEQLSVPAKILELAKLKYEELKNGYWKEKE